MKAIEIKQILSNFLKENGTEKFTKLISDAIDETGVVNSQCIDNTRTNFVNKFKILSELNLTER